MIEDKTSSKEHSEQLKRYHELVTNDNQFKNFQVLGIYFKTANQSHLKTVQDSGYQLYLRQDILDFINSSPKTEDTIFNNFAQSIQEYDKSINSWKNIPIKEWDWNTWHGFYDSLSSLLGEDIRYGYISNPAGGFLCASWGWNKWNNCEIYLQCEVTWDNSQKRYTSKIVFQIRVPENEDVDTREYRNQWHTLLM
ncbi:MAG: PD-(D/E)XK nuclease family protein [Brevinema sp.]